MFKLHNVFSRKELKKRCFLDNESRFTLSFYKYFNIKNPKKFRDEIYKKFYEYNIFGRIYIATEGINAQISIPVVFYNFFKKFLYKFNSELKNLHINKSLNNDKPSFWVLSIKVRKKILSDGINNNFFNPYNVGIYINAKIVNLMLSDNKVIFIDMRNSYEYKIGHFEKAIEIKSNTFREQLKNVVKLMNYAKNEKIVLYCTGGIRCEKATAWMRFNGFKHVYHIKGGIIGYVNDAKKNGLPVLFKGSNFVFDNRMSEDISNDILSFCEQCKMPSNIYVNCGYNLCHRLFIQCKICSINFNYCCSKYCMKKIMRI